MTFPLGTTTVNSSSTDAHNNTASGSFTVTASYRWSCFLPPINNDGSSIFKSGSTVPVKFRLPLSSGGFISDATAKITYAKVSNNIVGDEVEAVSTAAATTGSLFRYDPAGQLYIFNLGTKGMQPGTYQIKVALGDCVPHTVLISLK